MNNKSWRLVYPADNKFLAPLYKHDLVVQYKETYKREKFSKDIERLFSDEDEIYVAVDGDLRRYNNRKFRLHSFATQQGRLLLKIGPGRYTDYLTFRNNKNLMDNASSQLMNKRDYYPNIIGNIGILITSDNMTVAVKRSGRVSTYKHYIDFPGGHPEYNLDKTLCCDTINAQVINELYRSAADELTEDLGLSQQDISEPVLYAIIENLEDVKKPDMVFFIKTALTSSQVSKIFYSTQNRSYEVDQIIIFNPADRSKYFLSKKTTPIFEGAISLFNYLNLINCIR